jgi:hypothetical protein
MLCVILFSVGPCILCDAINGFHPKIIKFVSLNTSMDSMFVVWFVCRKPFRWQHDCLTYLNVYLILWPPDVTDFRYSFVSLVACSLWHFCLWRFLLRSVFVWLSCCSYIGFVLRGCEYVRVGNTSAVTGNSDSLIVKCGIETRSAMRRMKSACVRKDVMSGTL